MNPDIPTEQVRYDRASVCGYKEAHVTLLKLIPIE